jgi:hypothetical protein
MPIYDLEFAEAQQNLRSNLFSRWYSKNDPQPGNAVERMKSGTIKPLVNANHQLKQDDKIFTIGSCFARNVEKALHDTGFNVTSLADETDLAIKGKSDYLNRYNTFSILHELQNAAGLIDLPDELAFSKTSNGKYVDFYSHPILEPTSLEFVKAARQWLTSYFTRAFEADVVTITLGLIECWYDREAGRYINFAPIFGSSDQRTQLITDSDRFNFRVLSYEENMQNLDEIYDLLVEKNPNVKIIVTISPVRMSATFTQRDVVVANTLSKSMLRTCAESWQRRHPDRIDYFPSYEMAILSDPRKVWGPDGIHVYRVFVDEIMAHFKDVYVK